MLRSNNKVFEERREIFLDKLCGKAAIIPGANLVKHHADCEYPFRQDSNFWYLTGFDEPDAIALFLSHKPKGERFIMFVAPKDVMGEVWHGFRWGLEGAEKKFNADKAHSINELRDLLPTYLNGSDELVFSIGKHPIIDLPCSRVNYLKCSVKYRHYLLMQQLSYKLFLSILFLEKNPLEDPEFVFHFSLMK